MPNPLAPDLPDPQSVEAEVVLDLDFYSEGPATDSKGRLFFTDIAGKSIRYLDGKKDHIWATGRRPNGQAIDKNGNHLICDSGLGAVLKYSSNGKFIGKVSPTYIGGMLVVCPNDIALDGEGGYYFTDSVRFTGAVFHVDKAGRAKPLLHSLDFPNGVAYDRESKVLYVAESYKNRILKLNLNEEIKDPGVASIFAILPRNPNNPTTGNLPDGIKLDRAKRLWIAHYGMQSLQVLSETGDLLATYNTEIPLTSNLCFHEKTVWVTGGIGEPSPGRVIKMDVGIEGYPLI
nr:SMP-30/gluconolactonase/LRE family protein [Cytophagales bacterium]